jgi:23S rRNA pseudouridine955/2504/2580 synthase
MIVENKVKKVEIGSGNEDQRIDNFLITEIKNIPKSHVYKLIRTGQVRINSSRVKPSTKLKIGDIVRIPPYKSTETIEPKISQEMINKTIKNILYENDEIIVFNKPSSLAVHSGTNAGYGLIDLIRLVKNDCERIDLLNRLDKDTSGCILISKNLRALRYYQKKMKNNEIQKKYICLVKGIWDKKIKKNETNLFRKNKKKIAISEFKVIKFFENTTLLEVEIITGRYHQIRKQCSMLSHPIICDNKYGDSEINKIYKKKGLNRIFLHSYKINIKETIDIRIQCDIPKELDDFLDAHI